MCSMYSGAAVTRSGERWGGGPVNGLACWVAGRLKPHLPNTTVRNWEPTQPTVGQTETSPAKCRGGQ